MKSVQGVVYQVLDPLAFIGSDPGVQTHFSDKSVID